MGSASRVRDWPHFAWAGMVPTLGFRAYRALILHPAGRDSLHARTSEKGEGMRKYSVLLVFGLLAGAAPLAAQWESPTFFAPRPGEDLGLYYVSPAGVNEWGIHGIWRQEGNLSFGVRLGLEENEVFHVGA